MTRRHDTFSDPGIHDLGCVTRGKKASGMGAPRFWISVRYGEKPFGQGSVSIASGVCSLHVYVRPGRIIIQQRSIFIEKDSLDRHFRTPYRIKVTPRAPDNQSTPRTISSTNITIAMMQTEKAAA